MNTISKQPKKWSIGLFKDIKIQVSIFSMLVFPILILVWGTIFQSDSSSVIIPIYIVLVPILLAISFVIYGFYFIYKNKEYRFSTIFYFLISTFLVVVSLALAIIFISGTSL